MSDRERLQAWAKAGAGRSVGIVRLDPTQLELVLRQQWRSSTVAMSVIGRTPEQCYAEAVALMMGGLQSGMGWQGDEH